MMNSRLFFFVFFLFPHYASALECGDEALKLSRTITLKREAAAYGTLQHKALPLAKNEIVLTFDDGPAEENTALVLDALAAHCSKATFFLIGQHIEQSPALAKRIVAEGHSTGLHSDRHPHLAELSPSQQMDDLHRALGNYHATLGTLAPVYRFPFLEETPSMRAALEEKAMTIFSIDMTINDWQPGDTTELLVKRLEQKLDTSGGGVLLLHDANPATAKALPDLLALLKRKGYQLVHVKWEDRSR